MKSFNVHTYYFYYKGERWDFCPEFPVISPDENGEHQLGEKLRDHLGMTDEEAKACHKEGLLNTFRPEREKLLKETDWVVVRAAETGTSVPQEWQEYRQALRDITKQIDGMSYEELLEIKLLWEHLTFPEKPA